MRAIASRTSAIVVAMMAASPAWAADLYAPPPRADGRVDRSTDADALAFLAPLSRRSTANQDYGDAAYARSRAERRPPRINGYGEATGAGYESTPVRPLGYRPGFTYGPAYLSAPQIFGGSPLEQTPLLPFLGE